MWIKQSPFPRVVGMVAVCLRASVILRVDVDGIVGKRYTPQCMLDVTGLIVRHVSMPALYETHPSVWDLLR